MFDYAVTRVKTRELSRLPKQKIEIVYNSVEIGPEVPVGQRF